MIGFSDPQGGKGPADRMAATIKGHITRFINEENNVTNAKEMGNNSIPWGLPGIRVVMLDSLLHRRLVASVNRTTSDFFPVEWGCGRHLI